MNVRPRDRVALAVLGGLALVAGFYLMILKPERQKVTGLDSQISAARATLVQAQQSYATGRLAQASLNADAAEWAALKLAVPTQSDIPALLRTLQNTAAQVHVKMQAIALSGGTGTSPTASSTPAPTTTTSSGATTTGAPATGATASAVQTTPVPVQLTFAGGYTALDNLVRRLDALVKVSGNKVQATGPLLSIGNVSLSGAPKLTVQLTASLYQLSSPTSTTTGGQG